MVCSLLCTNLRGILLSLPQKFTISFECFSFMQSCITSLSTTDIQATSSVHHLSSSNTSITSSNPASTTSSNPSITSTVGTNNEDLLKCCFPHLNGLQSTVYQLERNLKNTDSLLQIIHVNENHWSVISTCTTPSHECTKECFSLDYYDSVYSRLPETAEDIISFLLSQNSFLKVNVNCVTLPKQTGTTDCGLYAIAIATSIAHNIDPNTQVFQQNEMRHHLINCIENKRMEVFPVKRTRHLLNNIPVSVTIYFCPVCGIGDDGRNMVQCDKCENWYHECCVPQFNKEHDWYCKHCI
jgi:hypothetical protein